VCRVVKLVHYVDYQSNTGAYYFITVSSLTLAY
jgi:hypothetical protein